MTQENGLKEKDGCKPSAPVNCSNPAGFQYNGKIYIRPIGRGICLEDDQDDDRQLEERLPEGYYHAKILITKLD